MKSSEILDLSAVGLARAIRAKKVTCTAAMEAVIARAGHVPERVIRRVALGEPRPDASRASFALMSI